MKKINHIYELLENLTNSSNINVINVIKQAVNVTFESLSTDDANKPIIRGFQIPNATINFQQNRDQSYFNQTLSDAYLRNKNKESGKYREALFPVPFRGPELRDPATNQETSNYSASGSSTK